jgi:ribosomal protein L7/L12
VTVTLSSIIDFEPFSDAVIITKSTGIPLIFNVSDGIRFYQLLDAAINSTQSSRNENKIESESEYEYDQELNQGSIDNELIEIISTKGLLNAVKFYKESENVSLREAKDYVDRLNEKIRK